MSILTRLGIVEIAFSAVVLPVLLFKPGEKLLPNILKDRNQPVYGLAIRLFCGCVAIAWGRWG